MSLEEEQKRENRHIELIRALDRITSAIGAFTLLIRVVQASDRVHRQASAFKG